MYKKKLLTLGIGLALVGMLHGCGGSDDDSPQASAASQPNPEMHFNRVASFPVCSQVGASCEEDDSTAAEIVSVSGDGTTLIYSNSPKGEIGFIDITDPASPKAKGAMNMEGEPTSVTVLNGYALAAVNTSEDYVHPSGKLVVVDIASQQKLAEIPLAGQPDSIAASKDGRYVAVVIENERDEDLNDGALPQLPAGSLVIVDVAGEPSTWKTRDVDLTGLATLYPSDPEPEYVDINEDNIAVVTLQENNHIVLVDLENGVVTDHFSAGSVNLSQIDTVDERPNLITFDHDLVDRMREPDGVTWISSEQFVIANEGDLDGGSRGFTIFNKDGSQAYEAGNALEHLVARVGHYNDRRSDAKGNEPENAEFGRFEGTDYLFVCSERSSVVAVYDLSEKNAPTTKQVLPAGMGPEGVLAIPSRNLLIAASEEDERGDGVRSVVNIYQYEKALPQYPTIESVNRADGTPLPWAALSGLAAASDSVIYTIHDSFFAANRVFELDISSMPAKIVDEIVMHDGVGVFAGLAAQLPDEADANAFDDLDLAQMIRPDGTVNIDPEGISMASDGGFWIASEGAGTVNNPDYPVTKPNMLVKLSSDGTIERIIMLPPELNAIQSRFGFEGVAESDGRLVVAFQRAWGEEAQPRLGIYDLNTGVWSFLFYPLDPVESPNGGWVGVSEITALGGNQFLVVERDNQSGPDARIKRLYRIDISGLAEGATVAKVLVRDLMEDLRAPGGNVIEKVEGSAVLPNGEVLIVTDNDGVDDSSGETQLLRLGKILE